MTKWLLVLAVVLAVGWLFGVRARPTLSRRAPPPAPPRALPTMVACAHCGVHLPAADALTAPHDGADAATRPHYCCAEHRALGPRR